MSVEAPHDYAIEAHLVGALIYSPKRNVPIMLDTGLEPGDLYSPGLRRELCRVVGCWADDEDPDPGLVDRQRWVYDCPQVSRPDLYCAQLLDLSARRRLFYQAIGARWHRLTWTEWWANHAR